MQIPIPVFEWTEITIHWGFLWTYYFIGVAVTSIHLYHDKKYDVANTPHPLFAFAIGWLFPLTIWALLSDFDKEALQLKAKKR